jgi:hypothetical protein
MQTMDLKRATPIRWARWLVGLGVLAIAVVVLAAITHDDGTASGVDASSTTSGGPVYDQAGHIRWVEQDLQMAPAKQSATGGPLYDQAGHIRRLEQDLQMASARQDANGGLIDPMVWLRRPTDSPAPGGAAREGQHRY